jgi:hypothetical protein
MKKGLTILVEPDDGKVEFRLGADGRLGIMHGRLHPRWIPHILRRADLETQLVPQLSPHRVPEDKHGLVHQSREFVDVFRRRGVTEPLDELTGLTGVVGTLPVPFFGDPAGTVCPIESSRTGARDRDRSSVRCVDGGWVMYPFASALTDRS